MKELFSPEQIAARVSEIGCEITEFYRGKNLRVIIVANGALIFGADLIRRIDLPLTIDTVSAASYRGGKSSGHLDCRSQFKLDVAGCDVLLVDEILDSGLTLAELAQELLARGAKSVHTAVAVEKTVKRAPGGLAHADWAGFFAPAGFLVGYGMDAEEYFRNLPGIAVQD